MSANAAQLANAWFNPSKQEGQIHIHITFSKVSRTTAMVVRDLSVPLRIFLPRDCLQGSLLGTGLAAIVLTNVI